MVIYNTGYSDEEIQQVKKSLHFRNTSYVWNLYHFNSTKNVGKCSLAAQEYYKKCQENCAEISIEDYEEYYFDNAIDFKSFVENSKKFKRKLKESGINITYELAYFYQWIRVIYDSYHGTIEKEFNILNELQNDECYIEHTDEETDRRYSIDLLMLDNEGYFTGIQIKPISFLNGFKAGKTDIINDFNVCICNQEKWLEQDGNKEIIWLFYDKDDILKLDFNEMKGNINGNSDRYA